MPVYNAQHVVASAIKSILGQVYTDFELLIVDDASTDKSLAVVESFSDPRIKVFRNTENIGYLASCNFLFQKARGKWLGFQDADDISSPQRIQKQIDFLNANADVVLCGTQAWYFLHDWQEPVRYKDIGTSSEEIVRDLFQNSQFCGASVIVRKDILDDFGGYQTYFDRIGNEDYDCFFRIAQKYKVANLSEYLYFVRLSSGSISRTIRDERQLITSDIVKFLAKQREQYGVDSLTGLDRKFLIDFTETCLQQFRKDPSLVWRKAADLTFYQGLKREALKNALRALRNNPFKFVNAKYVISLLIRNLL